ncbi:hypothetical protein AB0933_32715 [Streptomyces venezuelae]|uniref:hypothetical protein n=1 Tax=Streptomyces venezuelae TaxID=54571 RepID=UPI00345513B6
MLRKHRATILSILICGLIGLASGATWVWATGDQNIPPLAVIGLALITGLGTAAAESFLERRRTRRHRTTPVHRHRRARVR